MNKQKSNNKKVQINPGIGIGGNVSKETFREYSKANGIKTKKELHKKILLFSLIIFLIGFSLMIFSFLVKEFILKGNISKEDNLSFFSYSASYDNDKSLKVENVTYSISKQFNIPRGVRVLSIKENSRFYSSELRENDIIVKVYGKTIHSLGDIRKIEIALEDSEEGNYEDLTLTVYRNGYYIDITC